MSRDWLSFAAPLLVFGIGAFLATWWLRGRGFAEFRARRRDDQSPRDTGDG